MTRLASGGAGFRVASAALTLLVASHALGAQQRVQFERTGYRLTSLGARVSLTARVYDAKRRAVPNAPIAWRISDSAVASVSPQGIVVSRKPGYTKVWAVSGRDSASALILVDQWAAKFGFLPAIVRLDAIGTRMPLRVEMRDAAGHAIPGGYRNASCRAVDERVAEFAATGEVVSRNNGVTYVRCADRGVADSVRVEVRQRPVEARIASRGALAVKTVGDTFHVQLTARDRAGVELVDARPAWVSLAPTILSVDALSGLARAISPGEAKLIGDLGDATDTITVSVRPGAAGIVPLGPIAGAPSDSSSRVSGPALTISPLFLALGDTATVPMNARDATGSAIATTEATLMSNDTSVFQVISRQRIVAKGKGTAYLVARLAGMADSTTINVREKGAISLSAAGGSASSFVRPTFDTASARVRNARELDSALAAIRRASAVRIYNGRLIGVTGAFGQATHSTSSALGIVERRSGLMYGGIADLAPVRLFRLSGSFRTGVLTAAGSSAAEDLTVTDAEGDLTFSPADWFDLIGGYAMRGETTPLAHQSLTFPRAGAAAHFTFVGGAINTLTSFSVLPGAQYSDTTYKPSAFSMSGEAGLEMHAGVLSAGLTYYVERFSFQPINGFTRKDQFSILRLRLGLQYRR
jgi:hypothetical protein